MNQISLELTVKKPAYFNKRKIYLNVSNREAKILKAQLIKDFCQNDIDEDEEIVEQFNNLNFEDVCICLQAGNKDFFKRLNDETLCYIGDGCFCKRRCMLAEDA